MYVFIGTEGSYMAEDQIQSKHLVEINTLKIFVFFLDQLAGHTHYI